VEVVERSSGAQRWIPAAECGFAYRFSHFKGPWRDRYVITRVEFVLKPSTTGAVRYGDLRRYFSLEEGGAEPPLADVREAVLTVRRSKSMVLDPEDPNRRSAGSFFVNPVVSAKAAEAVRERSRQRGGEEAMPAYPTSDGEVKLSAAWLIERAGFPRGYRLGRVGISSRHTLALINRGGANAADLLRLAAEVRAGVQAAFGVALRPEPVFVGFTQSVEELLGGG
jgi:UDP-N-acetylmuramate dehydrogenase